MIVPSGDYRHLERLLALGQVGVEMVTPIGLGLAVDWWIGSLPWLTVVGAILGCVGGVWHLIYLNRPRET